MKTRIFTYLSILILALAGCGEENTTDLNQPLGHCRDSGLIGEGDPCQFDEQCQEGLYCLSEAVPEDKNNNDNEGHNEDDDRDEDDYDQNRIAGSCVYSCRIDEHCGIGTCFVPEETPSNPAQEQCEAACDLLERCIDVRPGVTKVNGEPLGICPANTRYIKRSRCVEQCLDDPSFAETIGGGILDQSVEISSEDQRALEERHCLRLQISACRDARVRRDCECPGGRRNVTDAGSICTDTAQCQSGDLLPFCILPEYEGEATSWVGGYCTAIGCMSDIACGSNNLCARLGDDNICLRKCNDFVSGLEPSEALELCRPNYVCQPLGSDRGICIPPCRSDEECGVGLTCSRGLCISP